MRPFGAIISLAEARRHLDANLRPVDRVERCPLDQAAGRVAASDVLSTMAVPPFARSAMDGYAVRAADLVGASPETPRELRVVEQIFTGRPAARAVEPGTCAEIATGAPVPDGADAVVMVEETSRLAPDRVAILAAAATSQNVRPRGADISPGDLVVRLGDELTPSRIGALAAIGRSDIDVFARPRVAIVSTGTEVVEPGRALLPGQIYDVNRYTLAALVGAHGGVADPRAPVEDTIDALVAALDACADADLIVFSGGSSVGERDLVVDLVAARGEMIFHGIAVKPGKPTAFALVGGAPFFGMPGNPTSCLSNAYIILVPFLRATARLPPFPPRTTQVPLGRTIVSQAGRHQFYTVRLADGLAYPAFKGSGEITSLSQADGYIEIPTDEDRVEAGDLIEVVLF